jgi:DNA-binding IclR family transcriptional regulator
MRRYYTRVTELGRVVLADDYAAMRRDFILSMLYESTTCGFDGKERPIELQSLCNISGWPASDVYSICALLCSDGYVAFSGDGEKSAVALTTSGGVYVETLPRNQDDEE